MTRIVGTYVMHATVDETGLMTIKRTRFQKIKPTVHSLSSIWLEDEPLTVEIFLDRIRNGDALVTGNVWNGGSLSIIETYIFLAYDIGCVKKDRRAEDIYRAFKGTFTIPKVNTPRALRDRKSTASKTYRDKQRSFRDFLYNLFADFCSINS